MALVTLPNGHFALENNLQYFFPIQDEDVNGKIVAMPPADVVSAATTGAFAASLQAVVTIMPTGAPDAGAPAICLNALVVESDAGNGGGGIGLVLTDTAGLLEDSATKGALFDIVMPPDVATQEGLDFPGVFTVSQPTPTAPGP